MFDCVCYSWSLCSEEKHGVDFVEFAFFVCCESRESWDDSEY